jgi:hypothetical protein
MAQQQTVREFVRSYMVMVQNEAMVENPVFGLGRLPVEVDLPYSLDHLRCSLRLGGRREPQLCLFNTVVSENTDETIDWVEVTNDEVTFYVICSDEDDWDCTIRERKLVTVNDHVTPQTVEIRARKIAVYNHDVHDIISRFDSEYTDRQLTPENFTPGTMHLSKRWEYKAPVVSDIVVTITAEFQGNGITRKQKQAAEWLRDMSQREILNAVAAYQGL